MDAKKLGHHGTISRKIEYWPAFVDVLMATLMVFILQSFLQTVLNIESFEIARIRQAQDTLRSVLEKEFSEEIKYNQITLVIKPNLLQIRFSDQILFPISNYHLSTIGKKTMSRCANVLKQVDQKIYGQIEVEGHTDNTPMDKNYYPHNNWELSTARALAVVSHLIENQVTPKKLSANGYAEFRPIDSNSALNRRIELRIIFSVPK